MTCLCCGKQIGEKEAHTGGWHVRCVRRFFGIDELPELDLSDISLRRIVDESVDKRLLVPGVQKKMSLHLSKEQVYRLTVVDYPTGYILKPQSEEYRHLPEYEYLTMQMARAVGIQTVPFALIRTVDGVAYITKRVDRIIKADGIKKYAMEDFCQLTNRMTIDKYKGSYEQCGKVIAKYSDRPGIDLADFFLRVVFSFITGNSDMHLKNYSLIETEPGNRKFVLAPAYDLLPVNLVLPADEEETALMLNGRKKNIHKKDFRALGENLGLNEKAITGIIESVCKKTEKLLGMCDDSPLDHEEKDAFKELILQRVSDLTKTHNSAII